MNGKKVLIAAMATVLALPSMSLAKDKKKKANRGLLESMQAVPCGVHERGVTGLGSIFGSIGIQHVNSSEKLCPQYLLRTDEMDYHIRPLDKKHAILLPVGHEGEFKIKKDRMYLKMVDEDKKTREYEVVSVEPVKPQGEVENTGYRPVEKLTGPRRSEVMPPERPDRAADQKTNTLPPQQ